MPSDTLVPAVAVNAVNALRDRLLLSRRVAAADLVALESVASESPDFIVWSIPPDGVACDASFLSAVREVVDLWHRDLIAARGRALRAYVGFSELDSASVNISIHVDRSGYETAISCFKAVKLPALYAGTGSMPYLVHPQVSDSLPAVSSDLFAAGDATSLTSGDLRQSDLVDDLATDDFLLALDDPDDVDPDVSLPMPSQQMVDGVPVGAIR